MPRILEMVAAIALALSCLLMVPAHHGTAFFVLLAVATLSLVVIVAVVWHDRRHSRVLPAPLARLALRSDEDAVAFAWRWRGRRGGRLRILRSEGRTAASADDGAAEGQTLIYDGAGEETVDAGVVPRCAYRYAVFAATPDGDWSAPLRLRVLTLSAAERRMIEASQTAYDHDPPATGPRDALAHLSSPDPLRDPKGLEWSRGGSAVVGNALGGLATDALLSAADVFSGRRVADGWEEVS